MTQNVLMHLFKQLPILILLLCMQVPLLSCGKKPTPPPEPPPEQPPAPPPEKNLYNKGEILLIEVEGYKYFAEVTTNTKVSAKQVSVKFLVEDIRKEVGNKVAVDAVTTKREKPKDGWGSQKVLLQYFDGQQWLFARDAAVFEDYYLLPESVQGERKVPLSRARIPIVDKKEEE